MDVSEKKGPFRSALNQPVPVLCFVLQLIFFTHTTFEVEITGSGDQISKAGIAMNTSLSMKKYKASRVSYVPLSHEIKNPFSFPHTRVVQRPSGQAATRAEQLPL